MDEDEDDDIAREDTSGGEEGEEALPVYLWKPSDTTDVLGEWEVHTKVRYKIAKCNINYEVVLIQRLWILFR